MKVGVLQFFSWPDRSVALPNVYEQAFERIDVMDRTGYDAVWLAEHHFSGYSVCPSIHVMGSHVAARTQNLRIGMGVSLASFYHPLRLAEEVALVDVLSGGRVNWGAGRGFDPNEFRTFGVPIEESRSRFHEAVAIVQAAWLNDKLTWHSEHWDFEDVEVLPKPAQDPHPPIWVAASSEDAVRWAGSVGHSILMDPHSAHSLIGEKHRIYRETLEANGHSIEGREIPMARLLAIAPTEAKAAEVARRGAGWMVGEYVRPQAGVAFGATQYDDPIERYLNGVVVHGTPDSVLDKLAELKETISLDYLLAAPLSRESFSLLTEKVLPRLI